VRSGVDKNFKRIPFFRTTATILAAATASVQSIPFVVVSLEMIRYPPEERLDRLRIWGRFERFPAYVADQLPIARNASPEVAVKKSVL
jgi:hypothetical protein